MYSKLTAEKRFRAAEEKIIASREHRIRVAQQRKINLDIRQIIDSFKEFLPVDAELVIAAKEELNILPYTRAVDYHHKFLSAATIGIIRPYDSTHRYYQDALNQVLEGFESQFDARKCFYLHKKHGTPFYAAAARRARAGESNGYSIRGAYTAARWRMHDMPPLWWDPERRADIEALDEYLAEL